MSQEIDQEINQELTQEVVPKEEITEEIIDSIENSFGGIQNNMSDEEIEQFLRSMTDDELLRFDRLMDIVLTAVSDDEEETAPEPIIAGEESKEN